MILTEVTRLATHSCLHCGTERPYGSGDDTLYPLLNCVTCKTQTKHQYKAINEYSVRANVLVDRIHHISFERATR